MADVKLTAEQRRVVEDRGGALLVSAGAGSGKTFVLVKRLLDAVQFGGGSMDRFLIITFTKAAAAELRWRIVGELENRIKEAPGDKNLSRQLQLAHRAQICTIDSLCSALLRRWAWALDIRPDFRQLDEDESAALRQSVLDDLLARRYREKDPDFLFLADTVGSGRDDRALTQAVLGIFRSTESLDDPESWLRRQRENCLAHGSGEPLNTPWGKFWAENTADMLQGRLEELSMALAEMEKFPELDEKYRPLFEKELSGGRYVLEALGAGWDAAAAALRSIEFKTLPGVKGAPEKGRFQTVRNRYKKFISDLEEQFSCPAGEISADMALSGRAAAALLALVEEFSQNLWRQKLRRGVMDFSDIERQALRLLEDQRWGAEIAALYDEVMVDEYQDINRLQERLFAALSGGGQRLFMVGDVKQAIYGFRLATPDIFLEKYTEFDPWEKARQGRGRKIDLNLNFRSRGAVLECANHICAALMSEKLGGLEYDSHQMLYRGAEYSGADPRAELVFIDAPRSRGGDDGGEDTRGVALEARYVAGRIAEMVSRGTSPGDIAILLRSPSGRAEIFRHELELAGVRAVSPPGAGLLDTPEALAFISILETLDNPTRDVHLAAAMMSPAWGFSPQRLAQIRANCRGGSLFDAVRADESADSVAFCAELERLRAAGRELAADELVWRILDEKGLLFTLGAAGGRQRENLLAVCAMAEKCRSAGKVTLYDFLCHLRSAKSRGAAEEGGEGAVKIMSVHKSKGLEFPVVFLCAMGTRFNRRDLDENVLFDSELGVGVKLFDAGKMIRKNSLPRLAIREKLLRRGDSEELRVLYVALTRAREKLIITAAPESLQSVIDRAGGGFLPPNFAMLSGASTPAVWLAAAALARPEGRKALAPESFSGEISGEYIWDIRVLRPEEIGGTDIGTDESAHIEINDSAPERRQELLEALDWVYPHQAASRTASKVTPSALEGKREVPEDAAALPGQQLPRVWQKPAFMQGSGLTAAQRGTALHAVMQYIDFEKCGDAAGIRAEIRRLVDMEFITKTQAEAADPEKILDFLRSPIGKRALAGEPVREFKFSVLMEAERWFEGVEGEKILLQGMIDLYYKVPGGLGILDFKTDRVAPGGEDEAAEKYRGQLDAYAGALERVTGEKVVERSLYFFATGGTAAV